MAEVFYLIGAVISRLGRDQEFPILGFPGRDFAKSRDPKIFRDKISLKFLSKVLPKKYGNGQISQIYMSSDGEFRCCHLVFGVFPSKICILRSYG